MVLHLGLFDHWKADRVRWAARVCLGGARSKLCVATGAVGMYQARPLSVSFRLPPAPGPHVARVGRRCKLRLAGSDTSWSNVTRAVGMYQARPLSVVDVTARRWRPAGSVGPIQVSREYLGALLRGGPVMAYT